MSYSIVFSGPFRAGFKRLKRKHPHLADDLRPLLEQLEAGSLPGDPIPGLEGLVFKARVASSDMQRGKSGAFRVIYYHAASELTIYLLTLYPKTERENINVAEIRDLISALTALPDPSTSPEDGSASDSA